MKLIARLALFTTTASICLTVSALPMLGAGEASKVSSELAHSASRTPEGARVTGASGLEGPSRLSSGHRHTRASYNALEADKRPVLASMDTTASKKGAGSSHSKWDSPFIVPGRHATEGDIHDEYRFLIDNEGKMPKEKWQERWDAHSVALERHLRRTGWFN